MTAPPRPDYTHPVPVTTPLPLGAAPLTLEAIAEVARRDRPVTIADDARATMATARASIDQVVAEGDRARAVKAFGRALASDPSLRANLWAIRRVFYRRGLWPNLVKLIDAELRYAADDRDRAELLTEQAVVQADRLAAADDARATLEEAVRLDPGALPALLMLERMAVAAGDERAQLALWQQLAARSELPARRLTYLLDQIAALTQVAPGFTLLLASFMGPFGTAAASGRVAVDPEDGEVARDRLEVGHRPAMADAQLWRLTVASTPKAPLMVRTPVIMAEAPLAESVTRLSAE